MLHLLHALNPPLLTWHFPTFCLPKINLQSFLMPPREGVWAFYRLCCLYAGMLRHLLFRLFLGKFLFPIWRLPPPLFSTFPYGPFPYLGFPQLFPSRLPLPATTYYCSHFYTQCVERRFCMSLVSGARPAVFPPPPPFKPPQTIGVGWFFRQQWHTYKTLQKNLSFQESSTCLHGFQGTLVGSCCFSP